TKSIGEFLDIKDASALCDRGPQYFQFGPDAVGEFRASGNVSAGAVGGAPADRPNDVAGLTLEQDLLLKVLVPEHHEDPRSKGDRCFTGCPRDEVPQFLLRKIFLECPAPRYIPVAVGPKAIESIFSQRHHRHTN